MSDALLKAHEMDSGNIITPKGRMIVFFNSLFEAVLPKGEKDESKAKYRVTLLLPEEADISLLEEAVEEVVEENVSAKARGKTKVKRPFLKTEDQERYVDFADEFPVMIRCNSRYKPDVMNPANTRQIDEDDAPDEVYSGRWCRLSVRPFFYDHPTGGKGVSLGLQNVQLLDHDETIAGGRTRGADEFKPVKGDDLEDLE